MGIVVLVRETMFASGLALMRVAHEAHVRGLWLAYAAEEDQLDRAGADKFLNFTDMILALERPDRLGPNSLSLVKGARWTRLNSYTHTGYQQIGARLTDAGIGDEYTDDELIEALTVADGVMTLATIEIAGLMRDPGVQRAAADRMKSASV
jgi:hypothetical protein